MKITPIETQDLTATTLRTWLTAHTKTYALKYLLAHAEDGVIWGHCQQELVTADQVFPQLPKLQLATLQQCRLFSKSGELLIWRDPINSSQWRSRLIQDSQPTRNTLRENQILWGTSGTEREGFTLLQDGNEGLRHAVPLQGIRFDEATAKRPVRLKVRHYINYDDDGIARIDLSRLVNLTVV